ncbi:hypothetical protein Phi19:2_gp097 [Cellulophaga phage phi19:2]|uniref:Uncharacterized protein n=3 Tax=Cellulophaga phage phiST TaxID=756282 RepID=M4SK58_9CAUD|nr:hypothetical protein CGPG_00013 [Cellulophaga phage phiST]AGH56712.1 hypothetical protein CGPG_00013 [Cellulophaga phage phiST]AGO47236.1 hypothetical protein PhiST_gp097 [Cellulophaga phage phiST]AGO48732.1 hypothetical protein Phi19:2_gp097 [Cellulophaga phage phi19:2]AGO49102.1 hypothetical protein Phi13:1_gp091 [Cellulophaga phage phi13:1]
MSLKLFEGWEKVKEELTQCDSIEEYIKEQERLGYIYPDGQPKKCECECTQFKQINVSHGEGWVEEYSLQCTNQDCEKIVGHWSYGHWSVFI